MLIYATADLTSRYSFTAGFELPIPAAETDL